jgi:FtsP/CotA-like multicopper oxidase with cupredoxin domain
MPFSQVSRRQFVQAAGSFAGISSLMGCGSPGAAPSKGAVAPGATADYSLTIAVKPVELAPNKIVSVTTYNGQFPGPLLRFREGQAVTIDLHNQTDTPEQLHWHGQHVAPDVDGAEEEGTPFIEPHGSRRIAFVPQPSGYRFYHTHVHARADLSKGQYSGLVGPVYIEPKSHLGNYDREIFLTLKEFLPSFSRGGDMDMDFLSPAVTVPELKSAGEDAMKASLAKGMPHGFEVGYDAFTINGRMLGAGEPIRVKEGERVLFHVLNGSATEIRSLALPGHTFSVVALDGNPLAKAVLVPGLWLGTAERLSAIVEMNHPGVWVLGDTANDDREHGMGIVVEYANRGGKPQWIAPKPFRWNYADFGEPSTNSVTPDQVFEMNFAKQNAALDGFNLWTINGVAFADHSKMRPLLKVSQGKRCRLRLRNASDDIHPIHLHRHTFEVTKVLGQALSGVRKDTVMLGGYQEMEIDFVAENPGATLFHCHQQLHMDFGFMGLLEYV